MARSHEAHHRLIAPHPHPVQRLVDQKQRDPAPARVGVSHGRDDEEIGEQPVADEMLRTVQSPTIAVPGRAGTDTGRVGPGARLGDRRSSRPVLPVPPAPASARAARRGIRAAPHRRCRTRAGSGCPWCGRTALRRGRPGLRSSPRRRARTACSSRTARAPWPCRRSRPHAPARVRLRVRPPPRSERARYGRTCAPCRAAAASVSSGEKSNISRYTRHRSWRTAPAPRVRPASTVGSSLPSGGKRHGGRGEPYVSEPPAGLVNSVVRHALGPRCPGASVYGNRIARAAESEPSPMRTAKRAGRMARDPR